jgi:hypothetical protein
MSRPDTKAAKATMRKSESDAGYGPADREISDP